MVELLHVGRNTKCVFECVCVGSTMLEQCLDEIDHGNTILTCYTSYTFDLVARNEEMFGFVGRNP